MWIKDKWDEPKGRALSVKVKRMLESKKTRFQQIDIYESECFGNMLVLDGVINVTEFDEFAYHEMLAHVPMHCHPDPKKVLVIGGGDGGVVREVLKHDVSEVHLCEIDDEVISLSRKYLPSVASGLNDSRVKIFNMDGAKFVKDNPDTYDVIIVDSSDPWGPADVLFKEQFYRDMHSALKEDGIAVTQSESIFYDKKTIRELFSFNKNIYASAAYYYVLMPTYPSGMIGFSFCSKKHTPDDFFDKNIQGLKYYSKGIHKASFVLPKFMEDVM